MKIFFLSLLLCTSAWAVNRSVTISPPAQVYAGQAFLLSASASTDATDSEQIGFFHGMYSYDNGASWNWFTIDTNAGKSATRNAWINTGVAYSTIKIMARVAFRGGSAGDVDYNGNPINWSGSWDAGQEPPAKIITITVQPPPNQAPTIAWVQNPASVWINQWFQVQARGNDPDGNLSAVSVWREWVPFAFNGGGNGWEGYSDANSTFLGTTGTVAFQAQSTDSSSATSSVIYHAVTVNNRAPTTTIWADGYGPAYVSAATVIHVRSQDPDSNTRYINLDVLSPIYGYFGPQGNNVIAHLPQSDGFWDIGYETADFTRNITVTFPQPGTYVFNGWSSDPYNSDLTDNNITIKIASLPTASASAGSGAAYVGSPITLSANYTIDTANGDSLVETAINVLPPVGGEFTVGSYGTGNLSRTFTPALGNGFGTFTVKAYIRTGIDPNWRVVGTASFTVANRPPLISSIDVSPGTIAFGQTFNVAATITDPDGNLAKHGLLVHQNDGLGWRAPVGTDYETWWNGEGESNWVSFSGPSGSVANGGSNTLSGTFLPTVIGTMTAHSNGHDGTLWASNNPSSNYYSYVTVTKANPISSSWIDRSRTGTGTFPTAFTAVVSNPYSGAVAAPAGIISYSLVGATGAGASPTSGAVGASTPFYPGTYSVRASYPGDGSRLGEHALTGETRNWREGGMRR